MGVGGKALLVLPNERTILRTILKEEIKGTKGNHNDSGLVCAVGPAKLTVHLLAKGSSQETSMSIHS